MKKFLALYRMDMDAMRKMMTETSPEDRKKGMDEWNAWMQANANIFADMGGPTGKNTQVTPTGASEVSNDIGGDSIVQAASKEEAIEKLKGNPHFQMPGAVIDIAEIVSM